MWNIGKLIRLWNSANWITYETFAVRIIVWCIDEVNSLFLCLFSSNNDYSWGIIQCWRKINLVPSSPLLREENLIIYCKSCSPASEVHLLIFGYVVSMESSSYKPCILLTDLLDIISYTVSCVHICKRCYSEQISAISRDECIFCIFLW